MLTKSYGVMREILQEFTWGATGIRVNLCRSQGELARVLWWVDTGFDRESCPGSRMNGICWNLGSGFIRIILKSDIPDWFKTILHFDKAVMVQSISVLRETLRDSMSIKIGTWECFLSMHMFSIQKFTCTRASESNICHTWACTGEIICEHKGENKLTFHAIIKKCLIKAPFSRTNLMTNTCLSMSTPSR